MDYFFIKLLIVAIIVFIINIPFGFFRSKVRKFSFLWFLYIHLPVPLVIILRIYSDIGFAWYTYPILIAMFFSGQFVGRKYIVQMCPCEHKEYEDRN